ncbi:PREDICTED: serine/threonine-protein kinase PINK1, mitochondrial isoform X2 [Ceratosolen solmsi marchali]|uniref:non-specific serine/threonine protein kinase n=1 Tax=Ceratosolen solmsi marchali TaxID=326594 RepID=A0AAJ6VNS2_9HYME|nr:PREDICTED: serine/threonine-protein kinase PINK1, mitochondrial isoform X2 [Ceratosolen solmsi marchali]
MSIRILAQRLVQDGRFLLRSIKNPEHFFNTKSANFTKIHCARVGESQGHVRAGTGGLSSSTGHLGFLGTQARRLFVDNVLKRVTNTLAAELRRRAARRLFGGDSAPFFALVGVSLASGTGVLTKEDELEGVCWEIREAVSKLQWNKSKNDKNYESIQKVSMGNNLSLKSFVVGPLIEKGCSAAVYAGRLKNSQESKSSNNIILDKNTDLSVFPLAIKMMFNYDAESNANAILKSMFRETTPAWKHYSNDEVIYWQVHMANNIKTLPPHTNIAAVYAAFADTVPLLPASNEMYPDALPARLNPEGSGRNMSLFLLMKRYDITLKQYVLEKPMKTHVSILLLAQLLEGVAHIHSHGIAHRDLKSDNILLDISEELDNCPTLVITDFGCCLADKNLGLHLPYNSHDIDKGGNAALMAPEIILSEPGTFTSLNYSKSDLWTVGAIAYEIFGMPNPFCGTYQQKSLLKNYNYNEDDLPTLPASVPTVIAALIRNMLLRSTYKRLSVEMATTVMHLHLWAPSCWFKKGTKIPSNSEIIQWLLCLTTKILHESKNNSADEYQNVKDEKHNEKIIYQRSLSTRSCGRRTMPEYQLIACFLEKQLRTIYRIEKEVIVQHSLPVKLDPFYNMLQKIVTLI